MSGLDPVVEKAMEVAFNLSNTSTLHILDEQRWMSLFPALIRKGYTLDVDGIHNWLEQKWPGLEGDRGMDNHWAIKVYAWAEMAVEQAHPSDWESWADNIIQRYADELAG